MKIDSKNVTRTFWRFVIPTTAALIVTGLYQIVDGFFIGNYIGQNGLSGINMVWPMIGFVAGFGLMIGIGAGALSSIEQGKGNVTRASKYVAQFVVLIILISIPLGLLLHFAALPAIRFQEATAEVEALGYEYIKIMTFGTIVVLGSIAAPMIVRNLGNPGLATAAVVVGAVLNIILDYIFIVKFNWSLKGAAIATLIGECGSISICARFIFSNKNKLKPVLKDFIPEPAMFLQIMKVGFSSMITYIYISVLIFIYNTLLMQYGGTIYVAAYAIIGYIISTYFLLLEGIAGGMQPLVSFFYGARQINNVEKVMSLTFRSAFAIGILSTILLMVFPELVINIFTSQKELTDITITAIRLSLCFITLDVLMVIVSTYFQAIGSADKAVFISICNIIFKFPFVFILPKFFGVNGIWISSPCCNVLLSSLTVFLYIKMKKRIRGKKEDFLQESPC